MKKVKLPLALFGLLLAFASCEKEITENINKYPEGATVWAKDTTVVLTDHYIVPVGTSLYVEEGVTVVFNDTVTRPEFIVLGNLYCNGTAVNPITFTVAEPYRMESKRFGRYWGGIICGYESEEVLLDYVTIEYGGAQTTEESASFQLQLFKTQTGEGVPAFHFCNTAGSFVIQNSTFHNNAEDQIYITGGKSIVSNNKFISSGADGGEAINYKSGCMADIAYNLIYDANSNGFKLSNSGALDPQSHLYIYNNSIVNSGWRRPKVKGGSIWLEANVFAELYNNLVYDCRWAVKHVTSDPQDARSVIAPNYFFASTALGVTQYQADSAKGQLRGATDIYSTSAGDKNPLFASYTVQSNIDINAGTTKSGGIPQTYVNSWNFKLSAGSPALSGGKTNFERHFATIGINLDGKEYKSPAPATHFGAFGAN